MAMKIITPGKLPDSQVYEGTCHNCGCVFVCDKSEVSTARCPGNQPDYTTICPTPNCDRCVHVYLRKTR